MVVHIGRFGHLKLQEKHHAEEKGYPRTCKANKAQKFIQGFSKQWNFVGHIYIAWF
jgi:hypothetical protein